MMTSALLRSARRRRRLMPLLCVPLLLAVPPEAQAQRPVTVAAAEFQPFSAAESGPPSGLFVEVTSLLAARAGLEVRFVPRPFARLYSDIHAGAVDVALVVLGTPERRALAYYSRPIIIEYQALVVPNGRGFPFTRLSDLSGKRLGTRTGFAYPTLTGEGGPRQEPNSSLLANVEKMLLGRIEAVVVNSIAGMAELRDVGMAGKVEMLPTALARIPLGMAFSRTAFSADEAARLDQQLEQILASRAFEALLDKYQLRQLVRDFALMTPG